MIRIKANNLHREFGSGRTKTHVLRGVSLQVSDGEFVGIMGRSGAGKSTLLYQLSLLDKPSEGEIFLNGVEVSLLSDHEQTIFRLLHLGFVFQDYALVPDLTASENVLIPLLMRGIDYETANKTAEDCLDAVGLDQRYGHLPGMLSGGEQQRVSIARAIAGKPDILFADEPTANLDSMSGKQVIELLTKLNREGQTIVLVTHEKEYSKNCHRVIKMDDGKIVS